MSTASASKQKARQSEFVRWFGPLLQALRDLGGSASPRGALDGEKFFEMFKRYELGLKPRTVYDIDVSFFEQFE